MIVVSNNLDPFFNLALEEHLLSAPPHPPARRSLGEGGTLDTRHPTLDTRHPTLDTRHPTLDTRHPTLFLWQSENAVVIGKNQNPWRECRLDVLEDQGGVLARRVSGGGAVYHDWGNLNVTMIVPRASYAEDHLYALVLTTLKQFGIHGHLINENCLAVGERKFSGNAFCLRKDRAMHHCTLLVSTDLDRLRKVLGSVDDRILSKAVASTPAHVMNLSEDAPDLTVERLRDALCTSFTAETDPIVDAESLPGPELAELSEKHASWDWRFGYTPPFEVKLEPELPDGSLSLQIRVEHGLIQQARVTRATGAQASAIPAIEQGLVGSRYGDKEVAAVLQSSAQSGSISHS